MGGLFAIALGAAFGVAAYRNVGPLDDGAVRFVVLAYTVAIVAAWLAGRSFSNRQWQMQMQEQNQDQQQTQQQAIYVLNAADGAAIAATTADDHEDALQHASRTAMSGAGPLPTYLGRGRFLGSRTAAEARRQGSPKAIGAADRSAAEALYGEKGRARGPAERSEVPPGRGAYPLPEPGEIRGPDPEMREAPGCEDQVP